jgi:hypothetical protein
VDVIRVSGFQQVAEGETVIVVSGLLIAVRIHDEISGRRGLSRNGVGRTPGEVSPVAREVATGQQ